MRVNIKPYPEFNSFIPYGVLGTFNYNEDGTVDFSVQTEEGTWNDFTVYSDEIEIKGDDLYLYMGGKIGGKDNANS